MLKSEKRKDSLNKSPLLFTLTKKSKIQKIQKLLKKTNLTLKILTIEKLN